ncbi:hypothetical protein MKQ70_07420 [Chitinophaga sedimenti]|uniref:hypothetical protein n=1 Tax=Chitinophaga sedimenti TaxID=2033606 RepID=UPI0020039CF8|nr:hypothetical protein [Chitinophaga sedimenti]MCK7554842.1 hypothetical protein [Chitinophaga sedimenti]
MKYSYRASLLTLAALVLLQLVAKAQELGNETQAQHPLGAQYFFNQYRPTRLWPAWARVLSLTSRIAACGRIYRVAP